MTFFDGTRSFVHCFVRHKPRAGGVGSKARAEELRARWALRYSAGRRLRAFGGEHNAASFVIDGDTTVMLWWAASFRNDASFSLHNLVFAVSCMFEWQSSCVARLFSADSCHVFVAFFKRVFPFPLLVAVYDPFFLTLCFDMFVDFRAPFDDTS